MVTLERLTLGTAPDSWGVWFPSDPRQVDWQQYPDEIAQAGYVWTELGPSGFHPQDPAQLRDELDDAVEACSREARLLTALGTRHLVLLPEQYTDMHSEAPY